jgi:solute carrier family 30 (zinc transporter), member 5/7
MQGVYLHVLADTLGSLGVIISTLCVKYFNLLLADALCSFLIATTIMLSGIPFLKLTLRQLVLETPSKLKRKLKTASNKLGKDYEILEMTGWRMGKKQNVCTVKIR